METSVKLRDSRTGEVRTLSHDQRVAWYTCGPTVYDCSHLGHARLYMTVDIMQRVFRDMFDYDVVSCMNVTDIDDKIIARAKEENCHPSVISDRYWKEFKLDMDKLNVRLPNRIMKVTDNIDVIQRFVSRLEGCGRAYKQDDGSVLFRHGASKHQFCGHREGEDFALWKGRTSGDFGWESPWGRGVPGWSSECAALASEAFGKSITIHAGGEDLKFPHHENEVAQSEVYWSTDSWVETFVHIGHLGIAGCKMSKSLKNFTSIKNFLSQHDANALRMVFLMHSWDQPMDFDDNSVHQAQVHLDSVTNLLNYQTSSTVTSDWTQRDETLAAEFAKTKIEVRHHLANLFDTVAAVKAILQLVRKANIYFKTSHNGFLFADIKAYISSTMCTFGLILQTTTNAPATSALAGTLVSYRAQLRTLAKTKKTSANCLFALSDSLRDDCQKLGLVIEDGADDSVSIKSNNRGR